MGDHGSSENMNISGRDTVFTHFKSHFSSARHSSAVSVLEAVRMVHPERHITPIEPWDCDLIQFAEAGHAKAILRRDGSQFSSTRSYDPPRTRMEEGDGTLGEAVLFGLYDYHWDENDFLVYTASWESSCGGTDRMQYILTAATDEEHCPVADELVKAVGKWTSELHKEIYVFDAGEWTKSELLWEAVQSSSWDDVILDPSMKAAIINDVESFFDSRAVYKDFGVSWKRGIIFHGYPGCGKTITIKALIKSLQERNVASLYVKSFKAKQGLQYSIREIFEQARTMAPCLLIFEDLDSLVVDKVRSYFLNEVDGLEKNDGILMIGSTNHLERLDPGISKRPSRFDRKYHYKLPGEKERILYCEYWRKKLEGKTDFDSEICRVVSQLTEGFSFAYLQELFVQTLLSIVGGRADANDDECESIEGQVPDRDEDKTKRKPKENATDEQKDEEDRMEKKKLIRRMPEVEITGRLRTDPLMINLHNQAKALWKDMDSSNDVHKRSKVGGDFEDDEDSDDDNSD